MTALYLLTLFSLNAHAANVRVISEGIRATKDAIYVATTTPRVHIATAAYGGSVGNVGLFTSSNVVVSSNSTQSCVVFASGTISCSGGITGLNSVTGSGAANRITFWDSGSNLNSASTLTYVGGNVGIGAVAPSQILHVSSGTIHIDGSGSPVTGSALCVNAAGNLAVCTSVVSITGTCTCP